MSNLPNVDDPLLQAFDNRNGRDHGAVTDHQFDLFAIGVIADPAVISQERVAEQFGDNLSERLDLLMRQVDRDTPFPPGLSLS